MGYVGAGCQGIIVEALLDFACIGFERSGGVAFVAFLVYVASKYDREDAEFKTEGHSLGHGKYIGDNVMMPMLRSDMTMT